MKQPLRKYNVKRLLALCLFVTMQVISFGQAPTARISSDPIDVDGTVTICANRSIQFSDVSSGGPTSRTWTFASGTPNTSSANNPLVFYNTPGTFLAILEATNAMGSDFDTLTVIVNQLPSVTIDPTPSNVLCQGSSITLNTIVTGGQPNFSYSWSPSTGLNSSTSSNPIVSGLITDQTYNLTVTDDNGCDTSLTIDVILNPIISVYAGVDTTLCSNDSAILRSTYSGGAGGPYTFKWTPSSGLNYDTVSRPKAAPNANTIYTLTVTDINGCSKSDQVFITASPELIADGGPDTLLCGDDEINIGGSPTALGGYPGYTYLWDPAGGLNNVTFPNPAVSGISSDETYTLRVKDSKGCIARDTVIVRYGNSVFVDAGGNEKICAGDSVQLNGSTNAVGGRYKIEWVPAMGLSDSSILNPYASPTNSTIYSLTVRDTLVGCVSSDEVRVFVNAPLFVDAGEDTSLCDIPDTPFNIGGEPTAFGGTPGYTFEWSPSTFLSSANAANPSVNGINVETEYYLKVTDSEGCVEFDTVLIKINPDFSAYAGEDFDICYNTARTIYGTGIGGTPPYTYRWFPGGIFSDDQSESPSITLLDSTTIYLMVVDSVGCTEIDTLVINVLPELFADAGRDTGICYLESIQIGGDPSAIGGTGNYTYSWSPGLNLNDSTLANPTTVNLTTNTVFTLTVLDDSSCVAAATVTVIPSPEVFADAGLDTVICYESPIQIGGSPTGSGGSDPLSYLWSNSSGASLGPNNTVANPFIITQNVDTWYYLQVTDQFGCSDYDTVFVKYNPQIFPFAGNDTNVCYGATINLKGTASGGTGTLTYSWFPPNLLDDPTSLTPTATGITNTTVYFLTVSDENNCAATAAVTIDVADELVVEAGTDKTVCNNDSYILGGQPTAQGGKGGNYTYSWAPTTGLDNPNSANPTLTGLSVYTCYKVTVTDSMGCVSLDSICVDINPELIADSGSLVEVCYNVFTPIDGSASGGTPPYSYRWNPGTGLSNRNIATPNVRLTADQSYEYIVTDAVGCKDTATLDITVLPEVIVNVGVRDTICFGDTIQLNANVTSGTPGYSYSWSPITGLNDPNIPNPTLTGITSNQIYTCTVTDSKDCIGSDGILVLANAELIADAGPNQVLCYGKSLILKGSPPATGGGGSNQYSWTPTTGLSNSGIVSPTVSNLSNDITYTFTVTDKYGCTSFDTVLVEYNPEMFIDLETDTLMCFGDSIQVLPVVTGGTGPYFASWSPSTGVSNPNVLTPKIAPTTSTNYTLTVTDSKGCEQFTTLQININPEIIAEAGNNVVQCFGDSVQIGGFPTGSGGTGQLTYAWNPTNNLSDSTISNPYVKDLLIGQWYYVSVTDVSNCTVIDSVFVTPNTDIIVDAGIDRSVCVNTPYTIPASVIGGAGGFTYQWSPTLGLDTPTILQPTATISSTQTYTLVATDANGCSDSSQITLTVYDEMTVEAGANRTVCNGDPTTLGGAPTALNGTSPYSFVWNPITGLDDPTSSNPVLTGLSSGTWYYVTATDLNGCENNDSVFVDYSLLPIADFNLSSSCGIDSACRNTNITLNDNSQTPSPGGIITNWEWDINNDGSVEYFTQNPNHLFTVLGNIPIKLVISSEFGCKDSIVRNIYVSETPTANFTINQDTGCTVLDAIFTNTSNGIIDTYNWTVFGDNGSGPVIIHSSSNVDPNPVPQFQQSLNGDTAYYIQLDVANCCGSNTFLDTVVVKPFPKSEFQWDYVGNNCTPALVDFQPDEFITGAPDSIVFNWGDGKTDLTVTPNQNPPYWNIIRHSYSYNGSANDTTFTVTLTAFNSCGQSSISKEITVKSNSVNAFMKIEGAIEGCAPFTTTFIDASSRTASAAWCFDFNTTTNACAAPLVSPNDTVVYTFNTPGIYNVALFVNNNCSYDTIIKQIEVFESPIASFNTATNRCAGEIIEFYNTSSISGSGNSIINNGWNFGDPTSGPNNTSNAVSPIHQFYAPGTYTVCLAVTSDSNPACYDTLCQDITIYEVPKADFTVVDACFKDQPLITNNLSIAPAGNTNMIYLWEMGDAANTSFVGRNLPTFSYGLPGNYTIRLTVQAEYENGAYMCQHDTTMLVQIDPSPTADFSYSFINLDSCTAPGSIQINNTSTPDTLVNYYWYEDFDQNPGQTPINQKNPLFTFNNPGLREIMLVLTNQYNCTDTIRKMIGVYNSPVANFSVSQIACVGDSLQFTDLSSYTSIGLDDSINQWQWDFGDGNSSSLSNPIYIYETPGQFSISLTVTTTQGCSDQITFTNHIRVDDSPGSDFTYVHTGEILEWQFSENVNGGLPPYTYYWDFGDSTYSTDANPKHKFRLDLYYHDRVIPICLTVTDINGCSNKYCLDLEIEGFSLFVPNALAPDRNTGGEETIFLPKGRNLIQYHLKIYDSWGSLIWETTSLDQDGKPDEPWTGVALGEKMPQGAYIWQIDAVFIDGTGWRGKVYSDGKTINIGTVNLLR